MNERTKESTNQFKHKKAKWNEKDKQTWRIYTKNTDCGVTIALTSGNDGGALAYSSD